mgnify:CR=1 FL=1
MYLKNIQLSQFKSYEEAAFTFNENVNALVGKNGSGKTNLLDAIYYLSFCKSYFSAQDVFSMRFGSDFFAIHGDFYHRDGENHTQISCTYRNGHKSMKANKKEYPKLSAHIGLFPVVMVSPYDSEIIHNGSEIRRKFFDAIISQFDAEYLQHLIAYRKLLQQRNALLKLIAERQYADTTLLQTINEQMAPLAHCIFDQREAFIKHIQPIFQTHYKQLTKDAERVEVMYQSGLHEQSFATGLANSYAVDAKTGFTNFGIHKDDYLFAIDGQPVRRYGSQGQQKSFSLALRLAQFDYCYAQKGIKPILLLDDIFDKLDRNRIAELLNMVGNDHFGQVFISDTDEFRVHQILDEHHIPHQIITIQRQSENSTVE